jgi:hypothetical protein
MLRVLTPDSSFTLSVAHRLPPRGLSRIFEGWNPPKK